MILANFVRSFPLFDVEPDFSTVMFLLGVLFPMIGDKSYSVTFVGLPEIRVFRHFLFSCRIRLYFFREVQETFTCMHHVHRIEQFGISLYETPTITIVSVQFETYDEEQDIVLKFFGLIIK